MQHAVMLSRSGIVALPRLTTRRRRWCDNGFMTKRKRKRPESPKQVAKLPPNADVDPAGPRLLPLPDEKHKHGIHPQIDSFVDLADNALKLWEKKKQS